MVSGNQDLIKPDDPQEKEDQPEPTYDELLAKITHPKQRLFLENYPKFRVIAQTAKAVGVSDRALRYWVADEQQFASAFTALKKEVSRHLIALHEQNIDNVAFGEKTPAQSRIFGSLVRLRAEAPEKYREKESQVGKWSGDVRIEVVYVNRAAILTEPSKQLKEGESGDKRNMS